MIMILISYVIQSLFDYSHLKIFIVCQNLCQFLKVERLIFFHSEIIEILDLVTTLCHDRSDLWLFFMFIFRDKAVYLLSIYEPGGAEAEVDGVHDTVIKVHVYIAWKE